MQELLFTFFNIEHYADNNTVTYNYKFPKFVCSFKKLQFTQQIQWN